jgi:hypothetical protein
MEDVYFPLPENGVGWNCSNVQGSVKSNSVTPWPPCSELGVVGGDGYGGSSGTLPQQGFTRTLLGIAFLLFGALIYRYRRIISKTLHRQSSQYMYELSTNKH